MQQVEEGEVPADNPKNISPKNRKGRSRSPRIDVSKSITPEWDDSSDYKRKKQKEKRKKHRSREKDRKKNKSNKERKQSRHRQQYQKPVAQVEKKVISKKEIQENIEIEEQNKLIDEKITIDEEEQLENMRKQRQEILQKYRKELDENQLNHSDNELENNHQQEKNHQEEVQGNNKEVVNQDKEAEAVNKEVDMNKQNYLKMLENLRDQEATGHIYDDEEPVERNVHHSNKKASKPKKDMLDMFESDEEDESRELSVVSKSGKSEEKLQVKNPYEIDDEYHYYRIQIGEVINKDFKILSKCGKGVFGNVVKALNLKTNQEVAIKILRSDEIYLRSGEREKQILLQLNEADKNDKKHIVRLSDYFEHRKHLCLIFESMDMNLREAIRTYGKGQGLSLDAVRSYSMQIFLALQHLRKQKIIHADIKPDNILISKDTKTLKICDFGTAFPVEENSLVEYLVSRYYRAPEIIIGYPYDTSIDMWSTACTMYELYTGRFLFPGENNNEMLKIIIQTLGRFSLKLLKRGAFVFKYFDQNFTFLSKEKDPVTRLEYTKTLLLGDKPTRDLTMLLKLKESVLNSEEYKKLLQFKDLLEKCLQLDPKNRMTPEEALLHPFINIQAQLTRKHH